jgi:TrmH family RNA methyltransferase
MDIVECYFAPALFLGENEFALLDKLVHCGTIVAETTPQLLEKMAYRERPEGLIAVARMKKHFLHDLPVRKNGLYLIAEAVEKPGNLGSILRSADAAGVDGLIICNKCTDIYNPNVIRASTGALFCVPLAEATTAETIAWLKENSILTLAATPHTDKVYTEIDMTCGIAIVVGTEQHGLSEQWLNTADINIRIPMLGKIDSLNVATAATILLYEAARQRGWRR